MNPPEGRLRLATSLGVVALAFVAISILGPHKNFYISSAWRPLAIGLSAALSLLSGVIFARAALTHLATSKAWRVSAFSKVLIACIPIAFLLPLFYVVLGYSLPAIYTRFCAGELRATFDDLSTRRGYGRGQCRYQVHGAPFTPGKVGGEDFYCASSAEFVHLPARAPMRVTWRQSWFGRKIVDVSPVNRD
jgi:hypothetical protein